MYTVLFTVARSGLDVLRWLDACAENGGPAIRRPGCREPGEAAEIRGAAMSGEVECRCHGRDFMVAQCCDDHGADPIARAFCRRRPRS